MVLCLAEPAVRFFWCWLLFFILLLLFIHFQATLPCHRHSILASQAREGLHQIWAPPWLLLIAFAFSSTADAMILGAFFTHRYFFYLTLLPQIFYSSWVCQGLPESRQFFLEVCRASCWSSKHKPGPSLCLIHSNPETSFSEEFAFKFYQILYEIPVVKV